MSAGVPPCAWRARPSSGWGGRAVHPGGAEACTPASCAGRARPRACERRAAAAGWWVPAEPTVLRLFTGPPPNSDAVSAGSPPPLLSRSVRDGNAARMLSWVSGALAAIPLDGAAALGLLVLALVRKRAVAAGSAGSGDVRNHHRAATVGRATTHALRRGRAAGRSQHRRVRRSHGSSAAHTWASRRTRHAREPVSCRGSNPGVAELPIRREATPACIAGAGST